MNDAAAPPPHLLKQQAAWLAPVRARLFRRAHIAQRRRTLDLACGPGAVTGELVRRCGGMVVAFDSSRKALSAGEGPFAGACRASGDAVRLPFADDSFEMVFCQLALMWLDAAPVVRQVRRVLAPGGVLVAIEPDFGGLIEHPAEIATRDIWLAALERSGADPCIGRKLPGLLAEVGLKVHVELLDRLVPPAAERFEFLRGLPLADTQRKALDRIQAADAAQGDSFRVAHLPMFLVTAEK